MRDTILNIFHTFHTVFHTHITLFCTDIHTEHTPSLSAQSVAMAGNMKTRHVEIAKKVVLSDDDDDSSSAPQMVKGGCNQKKPAQQTKGRGKQQDSDDGSEASEVPQMVKGGRKAQMGTPQKKAPEPEPKPASEEAESEEEEEEESPKPKKQQQKGKQKAKKESEEDEDDSEEDEPTPKVKKERKRQQDSDSEDEAHQRGGNKKEQKKDHSQQDADSESGDEAPIQQGGVNADVNDGAAGECSQNDYFNEHVGSIAPMPPRRLRAVAVCKICRKLSLEHCNLERQRVVEGDVGKGTDISYSISYSCQCSECKKDVKGDGVIVVQPRGGGRCLWKEATLSEVTPSLVEYRKPIADVSPVLGGGQSVVVNGTDSDGDGESLLIDAGMQGDVKEILNFVKYEDNLYISVSHPDQDHAGGALPICQDLDVRDLMFFHWHAGGKTKLARELAYMTDTLTEYKTEKYLLEDASDDVTFPVLGNISGLRHTVMIPNKKRLSDGWYTKDSAKCNKASLCNFLTASSLSRSQQPPMQIAITGDQTYSFVMSNLPSEIQVHPESGVPSFDLLWLPHHGSINSLDAALHPADFYVVHAQNGKDKFAIHHARVNAFNAVKKLSGSVTEQKKQHRSCVPTLVFVCKNFDKGWAYTTFVDSINIDDKTMRVIIVSKTPTFTLQNNEYDTHVCLKVPEESLVYERCEGDTEARWYGTTFTRYFHNSAKI